MSRIGVQGGWCIRIPALSPLPLDLFFAFFARFLTIPDPLFSGLPAIYAFRNFSV
jgi:hypothetical protein